MNMDAMSHFKKQYYMDYIRLLQRACDWIGISKGRAAQYEPLITEFFKENKRSMEHILAYNESCELIAIYKLWEAHINHFPCLKQKIREVFSKGPIMREHEIPKTSSNRSRNDAFVYLLAGKLISSGVNVVAVDGIVRQGAIGSYKGADISINCDGAAVDIECKRPQNKRALEKRVKEAHKQLGGRMGIIAVDCSAFIRPHGKLLEANSAEDAERSLAILLEKRIKTKIETYLETNILGFILFARSPAMTRVGQSPILSVDGFPVYTNYRPDSISTWLVIKYIKDAHNKNALK